MDLENADDSDLMVMDRLIPAAELVLQRFLVDCPADRRALYWRGTEDTVRPGSDGSLHVRAAGVLSFDTYFNSFFEAQWRRHTKLATLCLDVDVEGEATLRIHRRALGRCALVWEGTVGPGRTTIRLPDEAVSSRQHGLISIELTAGEHPMRFVAGRWRAEQPAAAVALGVVFCTFNREADITRLLTRLAAAPHAAAAIARVFIVNQGRPGLDQQPGMRDALARLGSKAQMIDQANFGGAGGFTRGLLAALDDPALTHAVLLDDDIRIEPDCMARMAAFYALCREDVVLGGHMLDLVQPTFLYEAGAVITERHWAFMPQHHGMDIGQVESLARLAEPGAVHYNGWWCCGLPLRLLRLHGLPLPCFIRGDDVEFGVRLHRAGIPTVPMPGIAVWHEPFYLKLGGWQLYYETRNMLVAAALHQMSGRRGVVLRMARQVALNLLTFRYYNVALILQGIRDFLAGPAVLQAPPLPLHAGLAAIRARFPPATIRRELVVGSQVLRRAPTGRFRSLGVLAGLMIRNAIVRTRATPARLLDVSHHNWLEMRGVEHVAVETGWDDERPTYHRSREHHRHLAAAAARLLLRLHRAYPGVADEWRAAMPHMTSAAFWRSYLGLAAGRERAP